MGYAMVQRQWFSLFSTWYPKTIRGILVQSLGRYVPSACPRLRPFARESGLACARITSGLDANDLLYALAELPPFATRENLGAGRVREFCRRVHQPSVAGDRGARNRASEKRQICVDTHLRSEASPRHAHLGGDVQYLKELLETSPRQAGSN